MSMIATQCHFNLSYLAERALSAMSYLSQLHQINELFILLIRCLEAHAGFIGRYVL